MCTKQIKNRRKISRILFLILISLGFQQFPVLRIGGSLKIYEILGILLLLSFGIKKTNSYFSKLLYIFFIVSPIISLCSFYLFADDMSSFYSYYPSDSNSFRFNKYIFPLLQVLFMLVNYVVCFYLYSTTRFYENFEKIKKRIVIIGFCIAVYSIIAMFVGDFVTLLPRFVQNRTDYNFRSCGFSQEPSLYVLYQGWIVLMTFFSRSSFSFPKWILVICVNTLSLLLTLSSSLLLFACSLFLTIFLLGKTKVIIINIAAFISIIYGAYLGMTKYIDVNVLNYAFYQKVEDFIVGKDDAGGSGGFRSYTSSLGWIMWRENPIFGVGVGNSVYYMHEVDKKSPIVPLDEQLHAGSFPQNSFSCVFAEQGLFGGMCLLLLLSAIYAKVWKFRKHQYGCLFLSGISFNILILFAISPVYSMFLWGYMFMALGYYRAEERKMLLKDENCDRL